MSEVTEGKVEDQTTEEHQPNEVEQKARRMGWVPKEEFRGDPEKWRPAEEFVERGENFVPILRAQVRRQDEELSELRKTINEFRDFHTKEVQNAYKQAMRDLKAQQLKAIQAGDTEAFVKIDERLEELRNDPALNQAPSVKEQQPEHPSFRAWKTENTWYGKDEELTDYADNIGAFIRKRKPDQSPEEFFDEVSRKVKREFPEKFENPRRNAAPSVEGTGNAPRKGGKTYADLPAEAKAACDRFVKQKLTTREAYVKSFFDQGE